MNGGGVFAEECSGLLPGQRAGVSPQPADLSPATVFMLRLVPQRSLPVVLPVFQFPSSSSSSPSSPFPLVLIFLSSHSSEHDTRHAHATALPCSPSWLKYLKTCHFERPHELKCNAQNICAPKKTSEDTSATAASFIYLKNSGAALVHKPSMRAISYIINP